MHVFVRMSGVCAGPGPGASFGSMAWGYLDLGLHWPVFTGLWAGLSACRLWTAGSAPGWVGLASPCLGAGHGKLGWILAPVRTLPPPIPHQKKPTLGSWGIGVPQGVWWMRLPRWLPSPPRLLGWLSPNFNHTLDMEGLGGGTWRNSTVYQQGRVHTWSTNFNRTWGHHTPHIHLTMNTHIPLHASNTTLLHIHRGVRGGGADPCTPVSCPPAQRLVEGHWSCPLSALGWRPVFFSPRGSPGGCA